MYNINIFFIVLTSSNILAYLMLFTLFHIVYHNIFKLNRYCYNCSLLELWFAQNIVYICQRHNYRNSFMIFWKIIFQGCVSFVSVIKLNINLVSTEFRPYVLLITTHIKKNIISKCVNIFWHVDEFPSQIFTLCNIFSTIS